MDRLELSAAIPLSAELRLLLALIDAVLNDRAHIYNSAVLQEQARIAARENVEKGEATLPEVLAECRRQGTLEPVYEYASLTPQERSVMAMRVNGLGDREIATLLEVKRPRRVRQFAGRPAISVEAVYGYYSKGAAKLRLVLEPLLREGIA